MPEETLNETLNAALLREHHEIDAGIEEFRASLGTDELQSEALLRANAALRRHIYLEEEFLFPGLKKAQPGMMAPVMVMVREHGLIWRAMDAVEEKLGGGTAATELKDACKSLTNEIETHNMKEEQIIYPQTDATLDAEDTGRLRTFMQKGTMPQGWVCAAVR